MGGRMQQLAGPTQDPTCNLEGKFLCKNMKQESMEDDASSAHVATKDKNKILVKGQVVAASKSISSSNQETTEEHKIFSCSSCPRKFSSQYAMAGHRNIHRSEWESIGQDMPDEGKMHRPKLPCNLKLSHFTTSLKRQSLGNSRSTLSNTSSTIRRPLPCALPYHLANPTITRTWPLVPAPRYMLTNPTDTLLGLSLGASHYTFVRPPKILMTPIVADLTHPLDNREKYHRKSELGVRLLSMIYKPGQFRQADLWSRVASTSFGGKQMIKGNIRRFGPNSNNFYLNFLSTDKGASSSSPEGGANNEVHDFFSSSFLSRGGKGIEERNFVACSPTKKRHNYDIYHSLEGLATHQDNNGENHSSMDIDLELKL